MSGYAQAAPSGITIPAGYTAVSSEAEFDEIYQSTRTKTAPSEKIFLHINGWKPTKTYYLDGNLSILGSDITTLDGSNFNNKSYFIGNADNIFANYPKYENLRPTSHFSLSNASFINFGNHGRNNITSIINLSSVKNANLENVRFIRNSINLGLGVALIEGGDCSYDCYATVNNSFFSRNRIFFLGKSQYSSFGVLALTGDIRGDISNTTFIDNVTSGGAAVDVYNSNINIKDVSFINNTSASSKDESELLHSGGGALTSVNSKEVNIENSLFADNMVIHENSVKDSNETGIKSGAVSVYNDIDHKTKGRYLNNVFLKNTVRSISHNTYGGAISISSPISSSVSLSGIFIGNRAQSTSGMGYGGAIHLSGNIDQLTIYPSVHGNKTIFYGNQAGTEDNLHYNSIYREAGKSDNKQRYIGIQNNPSDLLNRNKILMFDPIYWNVNSKERITFGGDNRGIYLGGNNIFDGDANISSAHINLTTVDYGNGIATNASVIAKGENSSIEQLDVRGSGIVQAATIHLSSAQATSITNTGILASDIHSKTSLEKLYDIDVKELASRASQITLVGNVYATSPVARTGQTRYIVDVSAEEHGKIVINGQLRDYIRNDGNYGKGSNRYGNVYLTATDDTPKSTKTVTVLSAESVKNNINLSEQVGIISDRHLDVDAHLIDIEDNDITVQYTYNGLMWNTHKKRDDGSSLAHGTFYVGPDRTFVVNESLHNTFSLNSELTKEGYGELILNSNNTYTGKTLVRGGILTVGKNINHLNARVAGDIEISPELNNTAFINGYGSIGGDLKFNKNRGYPNLGYIVFINPDSTSSKLTVDGKAHLHGTLLVIPGNGTGTWQDVTTYTILEAKGGIEGTFRATISELAFLRPKVTYHANEIELTMERIKTGAVGDPNKWNLNWSDDEDNVILGASSNQVAIRRGIIALPTEHPVVQATIDMVDDEQIKDAMDNLSGEVYSSSLESQMKSSINNNSYVDLNLLNSWRSPSSAKNQFANLSNKFGLGGTKSSYDANMWVNTWSTQSQIKGDANAAKASISNTGMVLGLDTLLDNEVTLGALAGYEMGRVKVSNTRSSELNTSSAILGGYALTGMGDFDISAGLTYVQMDYDSERSINVGAINDQAKADYKGNKIQAVIEGSKLIDVSDNFAVAPYINLAHHIIHTDKISEDNSQAALEVAAQTNNVSQLTAGSRVAYKLDSGVPVTFTANAGYQMRFGDTNPTTTHSFKGTDTRFEVQGATVNQNRLTLGVGVEAQFTPKSKLVALYNNEDKSATLSLGIRF